MTTFIVSDLHLFDHSSLFLFNAKKERAFVRLCEVVSERGAKLLLAGDIFDFTGMTPCRHSHREFFLEAVPSERLREEDIARVCRPRSTLDLLASIQQAFPYFFAALARLGAEGRLLYIPGNHDCDFMRTEGRELFTSILDLPPNAVQWLSHLEIPKQLIVAHGHEFDPSNRTPHGCANPGFVFASALYQGVLPALRMLGMDEAVLAAIPAVRPEEETVIGIQSYLGDETCRRILLAFARLLQRNGFFQGFSSVPAWFLSHDFPVISRLLRHGVSPERIRAILPQEERLREEARQGAEKLRSRYGSAKSLIVLGHTHEMDTCLDYVNLGTWIDHITGLDPKHLAAAELSLPVLFFEPEVGATLFDVRPLADGGAMDLCPVLWRRARP